MVSTVTILGALGFLLGFVGPVVLITYWSVRDEAHSPPPLRDGGADG